MAVHESLQALMDASWAKAGEAARAAWSQTPRMTAAEVADFLAEQRHCAMATTGASGDPHLVPVSFLCLPDASFWLPTMAGSRRLEDVRRHPRAAIVVGQGVAGGRTLVIANGIVEIVALPDTPARVRAHAGVKLGDTSWATCWLVMRPRQLIAYRGGDSE